MFGFSCQIKIHRTIRAQRQEVETAFRVDIEKNWIRKVFLWQTEMSGQTGIGWADKSVH